METTESSCGQGGGRDRTAVPAQELDQFDEAVGSAHTFGSVLGNLFAAVLLAVCGQSWALDPTP